MTECIRNDNLSICSKCLQVNRPTWHTNKLWGGKEVGIMSFCSVSSLSQCIQKGFWCGETEIGSWDNYVIGVTSKSPSEIVGSIVIMQKILPSVRNLVGSLIWLFVARMSRSDVLGIFLFLLCSKNYLITQQDLIQCIFLFNVRYEKADQNSWLWRYHPSLLKRSPQFGLVH